MVDVEPRLYLTVLLYLKTGQQDQFHEYERLVKPLIERYGGRFEHVLKPTQVMGSLPRPDEVHLLSFPSEEHFQQYRDDPNLSSLASLRAGSVAETIIISGVAQEIF
jgi:uncharacterized protein (DUF1330 family)